MAENLTTRWAAACLSFKRGSWCSVTPPAVQRPRIRLRQNAPPCQHVERSGCHRIRLAPAPLLIGQRQGAGDEVDVIPFEFEDLGEARADQEEQLHRRDGG